VWCQFNKSRCTPSMAVYLPGPLSLAYAFVGPNMCTPFPPPGFMCSPREEGGPPAKRAGNFTCKGCRKSSASYAAVWSASICRSSPRHASSRSHSRFRRFFLPPHNSQQQRHVVLRPAG
jgi:hypothetical protein